MTPHRTTTATTHVASAQDDSVAVEPAANNQIVAQCWLAMDAGELTVDLLLRLYVADIVRRSSSRATKNSYRSWARTLREVEIAIGGEERPIGTVLLDDLERKHCAQLLARIEGGPRTANALCGFLRTAVRWAITSGLWNGSDPTDAFVYREVPPSERALGDRQIRGIFYGLDVAEVVAPKWLVAIDTARILLAIGCRPGDLRSLRTAEVDLEGRWISTVQKGDRLVDLPFPQSLDRVMARRVAEGGTYLIPGTDDGKIAQTTVSERWRALKPIVFYPARAREDAGLTAMELAVAIGCSIDRVIEWERSPISELDRRGRPITQAHFRACNVTTKVRRGVSTRLAGASVGHESEATTRAYLGPLFEHLQEAAKVMDDYIDPNKEKEPGDPAEVVGQNLKRIREELGLSQAELGARLGETGRPLAVRTIRDYETRGLVNLRLVDRLAKALGVSRARLLEGVV